MLNQKKVEIFLVKFRKPPTRQFLEVAIKVFFRANSYYKHKISVNISAKKIERK